MYWVLWEEMPHHRFRLAYLTDLPKQGILFFTWGWLSPGGLRGLQNRLRGAAEAALVGSTPIHSRAFHPSIQSPYANTCHAVGAVTGRGAIAS